MIKEINTGNLNALCRGSYFFGSGGGGCEKYLKATVEQALEQWGAVPLISVNDLEDDDNVVAISLVGSPIPDVDVQAFHQQHILPVLQLVINDLQKPIKAIMPVEIGGVNALTPFCIAGVAGLPVLDADLKGRSLPEISMNSSNIHGKIPHKAYIGNPSTGEVEILICTSYTDLEIQARSYSQKCALSASVLIHSILSGAEAKRIVLSGSISRSIFIGQQVELNDLIQAVQGNIHCQGKIIDYSWETKKGFLIGTLWIRASTGDIFRIEVKNEFLLLADENNNVIAEAPDIISLFRADNLRPTLSDQITIGDEVICVTCKGPDIWYSDVAMALLRPNETLSANKFSATL